MQIMNTQILIVGTGALANLFAVRFCSAQIPHIMLGNWPEGLNSLRKHGVRLVDQNGGVKAFPVKVISGDEDLPSVKLALVLVKSWQTERAADQIKRCLDPDGFAVTLQNGLGNREKLVEIIGENRVGLGVTTTGATLLGPGQVRLGGKGKISLERHPKIQDFEAIFSQAGFEIDTVENVDSLMWGKLVINSAINPLTAILRVANGELLDSNSSRTIMGALAKETAKIATSLGILLPFDDPVMSVEDVVRRTAKNRSSMLQDVTRGATTEIDAICGEVVRVGENSGIPTPVNRTLWLLVRAAVGR